MMQSRSAMLKRVQDIARNADAHGRKMTSAERREVEDTLDKIQLSDAIDALGGDGNGWSVGVDGRQHFTGKGRPQNPFGAKFAVEWNGAVQRFYNSKAGFTLGTGDLTLPAISSDVFAEEEPSIASLLSQEAVDGADRVSFMVESAPSYGAGPVAKSGTKPETELGADRVEVPIEVIAHVISDVPNQDLADSRFLSSLIDRRLRFGLVQALDDQILNGTSSIDSPNPPDLCGILAADIGSSLDLGDPFTSLRGAIADLRLLNVRPTAVVVNPADAALMDSTRDSEVFLMPNGVGSSSAPWGLRRVESVYIDAGSALVGDFAGGATLVTRSGFDLLADPYTAFKSNETSFRAEARFAVLVKKAYAFATCDLGTTSG